MNRPEVLGVIPARGGSKGIPRKNLALLGGRPLIAYTCEAARESRRLTRVVVSTEDEEIARVALGSGIENPFLRPAHLADDDTPIIDVLVHLLAALEEREAYRPAAVVLLQPTSPFRRAAHIDAAVDLLDASGADSIVSIVPVPHQFTPSSLFRLEGDRLRPLVEGEVPLRRQDKPRLFARNGPAVLAVRRRVLVDQNALYGADTRGLEMTREESIDIDDVFDLKLAALLIEARSARRSIA